jgi:DNA-binding MarR family transcriptional regulator
MAERGNRSTLDAESLQTWAAFATVLEWLPAALDTQLERDSGMTHFEYGILFALSEADDTALRMSTLAGYSNSSLSRLSRAVSRLERKGWVQRTTDPRDGRCTLATLTGDGARKVHEAAPGHVETVDRLVFEALTASQARQLREISQRIMRAIRADDGWQPPQASVTSTQDSVTIAPN